jgi:glycosyltransferase involved in cell wall biosynthesis
MKSLSIFFPAYNDEVTIPKLVKDAIGVAKEFTDDYEIIVVNDCSPDNVGKVADDLAKKDKHIKVIHHERNKGYGGVLKSGFKNSTKDLIFYTDGDGQYDVNELRTFLPYIKDKDIDMVNGYKKKRSDTIDRVILGRMYHYTAKILFGLKIKDVDCDFRLFKRHVIDNIELESDSGVICVEMIKKIQSKGFKIKELPVHHYPRISGKSQFFEIKRVLEVFKELFKYWWELVILRKDGL